MSKITLILLLVLSACAPKDKALDQPSTPNPAPGVSAPTPAVLSSTWCGELIISTMGLAFKTDLATGAVIHLEDGIRDFPAWRSGWGEFHAECKYEIKNGIPQEVTQ